MVGDININTLTKNSQTENYMNVLNSFGCKLLIDLPIRFADNCKFSLLDYIYTNIANQVYKRGVCICDISDHLPTFFIAKNIKCVLNQITNFKRDKSFKLDDCLIELNNNLSKLNLKPTDETNVNQDVPTLTTRFNSTLDKHAP